MVKHRDILGNVHPQVMIRAGELLGMKDVFSKLQNFQDYGTS